VLTRETLYPHDQSVDKLSTVLHFTEM